jgi:hypothetical protein
VSSVSKTLVALPLRYALFEMASQPASTLDTSADAHVDDSLLKVTKVKADDQHVASGEEDETEIYCQ